MRALACWYDPKPVSGAFERLRAREYEEAAPALEYLVHVLPRPIFGLIRDLFESRLVRERERDGEAPTKIGAWIRAAWSTGDAWMRACAVRASALLPDADRTWFAGGERSAMVDAEIAARFPDGGGGAAALARPAGARAC
jgi:hypothetical protein